jgi:hypothetical protein
MRLIRIGIIKTIGGVLTLINDRLQADSNDVLALSLKSYVFVEKNMHLAHQAANSFLAIVNAGTTKQDLKDQAQVLAKRVTDIPADDTTTLTEDQRNSMHAELDKFPFIEECFVFWGKFTGQL